jgi:hypothetical protein
VKRLLYSIIAASALAVSSIGAVAAAAPPAQASCVAHLVRGPLGPPGLEVVQFHPPRFGSIVSFVAKAPGSTFEQCFEALLEANE